MLQLLLLAPLLAGDPALGHWRAALGPADSEVLFDLVLAQKSGALAAEIQNGDETIAVPEVIWHGSDLQLGFPHYDARITAKLSDDGKSLRGEWKKRSGKDKWTALEFRAQAGGTPCYVPLPPNAPPAASSRIEVKVGESTTSGTLVLRSAGGYASGTVLTPGGDLRYLSGSDDGTRLRLSGFDGFFAIQFDGRKDAQGLSGTCRLGASTGSWTASGPPPELRGFVPDLPRPRFPLEQLSYSDLDGVQRALAEPLFEGKPMLISIGGSWCPNCHDEMRFLAELDAKYGPKGLAITELLFEYSGDFQRDALQARRMAERHGAKFRILLGGTAGKGDAAKAFPVLPAIKAYPTTLFVTREGMLFSLHEGFSGPAAGAEHEALRDAFEKHILDMLASPAPSSEATWNVLLSTPMRDTREGLFLTIRRKDGVGSYEAEEFTRFDGPTRQGIVESGEVRVNGALVRLGQTFYRWDPSTTTFYDPTDFAHRLMNAVRPNLPVLGGQMIHDADELATKLVSEDSRWRAETRYHLTRAIQSMQAEPRYETWRGIDDEDPWAACAAVWSAGELGRIELCEGIARLLEHPFAPLRHEAVRALGSLGYDKAQPQFERMAKHDLDGAVRAIAANPPVPRPPPGPPPGGEEPR